MYTCNLDSMRDKIETFSKFGDAGHGGITRYALSEEDKMAREEWLRRMKAIGATIEMDDLANMYATLPGSEPGLKRIAMGSHCDSVKNGGNYDGILGVMSAMEVLETVARDNIPHRHPLTAMIFTNEEGSEFPPCMMCSGTMAHDYMPERFRDNFAYEKMMASRSILTPEVTFAERLAAFPYKGDKANRMSPEKFRALFETHIEQGPILEDAGKDINRGIFLDVFPMDALPDSPKQQQSLRRELDIYKKILDYEYNIPYEVLPAKGRLFYHLIHLFFRVVPYKAFFQHFNHKVLGKYSADHTTEKVADLSLAWRDCVHWKREWFTDFVYLPFENLQLRAPYRYKEVLSHQYGDYMKIPDDVTAPNGRCHGEVTFEPDVPYTEYFRMHPQKRGKQC